MVQNFWIWNPVDENVCAGFSVVSRVVLVMILYAGTVVDKVDEQ